MKTLTPGETGWIAVQLKKYKTTFPEFYAEVYDHVLSAIEVRRYEGDDRDLKVIYQQVIDDDFNGYKGIQKNALQHFVASRKGVWDVFVVVFRKDRNVNILLGLALVALICVLPLPKVLLNEIMAGTSLALAIMPLVYSGYRLGLKKAFWPKEIKASTVLTIAMYAIHLFNLLYVITFTGIRLLIDQKFKAFNCPPIIAASLMVFLLIYNICFVQFFNLEFNKRAI